MNDLIKMPFMEMFEEKYKITHTDVLLNSITVASVKGNYFGKEINFEIKNISGELVVYPLEKAEKYVIKYDRVTDSKCVIKPKNEELCECLVGMFCL